SVGRRWGGGGKGMIGLLAGLFDPALGAMEGWGRVACSYLTDPRLQAEQRRIPAALSQQVLVGSVLDQPPALDRDDPVCVSQRRQAVRDDEHCSPFGYLLHVVLDDPLAFVIERGRC